MKCKNPCCPNADYHDLGTVDGFCASCIRSGVPALLGRIERLEGLLRAAKAAITGRGWIELQIKIDAALKEQTP